MSYIDQAARVTGPIAAADATWRTGVIRVAVDGTQQSLALPTTGKDPNRGSTIGGRFIRILAMGANVQFAQGRGTAPALVLTDVASGGPPVTPDVNSGATLVNGIPDGFIVDSQATHFGYRSDAAGFLEFFVSDKPVP